MHIDHAVVGAGLIGGYLTAHLAELPLDLSLLVVGRAYAQTDFTDNLYLSDYESAKRTVASDQVIFKTELKHTTFTPAACVWLTVKCTAMATIADQITPLIGPETLIICCQNGIGSEHNIVQQYPDNVVIRCMFPFNVVRLAPGHFHRGSSGTVMFEHVSVSKPTIGFDALVTVIEHLARQSHSTLPIAWCDDMDGLLWAKCQVNLTNSVNALANLSLKETLMDRGYRRIIATMMREHLAVCAAQGIVLPKITKVSAVLIPSILSLPNWLFPYIAKSMVAIDPHAKLSMWWDIEHGRPTEIDYINGATIRAGKLHHIDTPMNNRVYNAIKSLELAEQRYAVDADLLATDASDFAAGS